MLRVGVIGARGRMGTQVCLAVDAAEDLDLVATVGGHDWLFSLADAGSEVIVDFTHPDVVMDHIRFCIDQGIHCVVGTSGIDVDRQATVRGWIERKPEVGVIVVPNFAIGAVLASRFARQAARFFESAEIVELHHAKKIDAPSGNAMSTAQGITEARRSAGLRAGPDGTTQALDGARGALVGDVRVHSVRLPGLISHQEVLLGSAGELLTIRHDSSDRSSFMPGVLLAIRQIGGRPGLTLGLESLLGLE